jgi:drug/metabolite transporter (DMT)-like permease
MTPQPAEDRLRGIALMLASVFLFTAMDGVVKWLAPHYPTAMLVFCRSLFAFVPLAFLLARSGGLAILKTERPYDHLLRAGIGFASLMGFFYSFGAMQLADVVAISFSAPLFMTALSVWLLGEEVRIFRWAAVAVGFVGVLLIVQPGGSAFQPVALVALGASVLYALAMIQVRKLSSTEAAPTIVFYFTLFSVAASGVQLPFVWIAPRPEDYPLLVTIGLLGGIAQLLMTQAYRFAPVSVIAPFDYTHMLWAVAIGWLVWSELPTAMTAAGSAVVVASGLFILYRETRRARPNVSVGVRGKAA